MTSTTATDRGRQVEELASEVGPLAFGIAYRMLGDQASAEDALQDAYLQAYRGLRGFRGDASQRTWFLRIVVNCCKRRRRVWRRWTAAAEQLAATPDNEPSPGGGALGDPGLRQRLNRAVVSLPHRQRTAFVLRYTQELAINEIADIMGCAPGTVKATIHQAVAKLRRELRDLK